MPLQPHNPKPGRLNPHLCEQCGDPVSNHRVEHKFRMGPAFVCVKCGLGRDRHRDRGSYWPRGTRPKEGESTLEQIRRAHAEIRASKKKLAKREPIAVEEYGGEVYREWKAKNKIGAI